MAMATEAGAMDIHVDTIVGVPMDTGATTARDDITDDTPGVMHVAITGNITTAITVDVGSRL
jgi:hypothetical protein